VADTAPTADAAGRPCTESGRATTMKRGRTSDELPYDLADLPGLSPTGFCPAPLEGAALADLAFSESQVERFSQDGYVATDQPVLTPSQLAQLRAELDALTDQENPHPKLDLMHEIHFNEAEGSGQVLFHSLGHWRCSPGMHDLAFLDTITLKASQLVRAPSRSSQRHATRSPRLRVPSAARACVLPLMCCSSTAVPCASGTIRRASPPSTRAPTEHALPTRSSRRCKRLSRARRRAALRPRCIL
jgi:hypothetical protein